MLFTLKVLTQVNHIPKKEILQLNSNKFVEYHGNNKCILYILRLLKKLIHQDIWQNQILEVLWETFLWNYCDKHSRTQLRDILCSNSNAENLVIGKAVFGHDIYQYSLYKSSGSYWLGRATHMHLGQNFVRWPFSEIKHSQRNNQYLVAKSIKGKNMFIKC